MKRFLTALLAIILILPCTGLIPSADAENDESYFKVVFLNVGKGDAAFVECDGYTMLIDGGAEKYSSLIYSFLKKNDIRRLDYIVASHPDADHIGGLPGALNYAQSGIVLCTTDKHDTKPFKSFVKHLKAQDNHITVPDRGDVFSLGSARIDVLYPARGEAYSKNTSLVLRIEYGETSFLFTGDCELEDELALVSSGEELNSTVLKVAHHGSGSSSSAYFLANVSPEYAVISTGESNEYGHPSDKVLKRLGTVGAEVYRTDLNGDITMTSDGRSVTVQTEKGSEEKGKELISTAGESADAAGRMAAAPEPEETDEPAGVSYVLNTNSGKFHYPECESVRKMKEANKQYYTGTRDELIRSGYTPCGKCNP